MLKFKLMYAILLALPATSLALGFQTEPDKDTLMPAATFEVGEGAINTLINHHFIDPIYVGEGLEEKKIEVKRIKFDLEQDTCYVDLIADVTYGAGVFKQTERIYYNKTFTSAGAFTYDQGAKQVRVMLPGFIEEYKGLPYPVRLALKQEFENLPVYSKDLLSGTGGGVENPIVGTQIHGAAPMFYMGFEELISFQNDFLRVVVKPIIEAEDMTIEVYRQTFGPPAGPLRYYRYIVITNFQAEMTEIYNNGVSVEDQYPMQELATSGPLRTRRYTYSSEDIVVPSTNPPNSRFSAVIRNGANEFRVRTGSLTGYGAGYYPLEIK